MAFTSQRKLCWAVHCKQQQCRQVITFAPVESDGPIYDSPGYVVAVECPVCGDKRRYHASEVWQHRGLSTITPPLFVHFNEDGTANVTPQKGDYWLIGIKAGEITVSGSPNFINELIFRFRGRELKREGSRHLISCQTDPTKVRELQRKHGTEFESFYYVDVMLAKAAEVSKIKLKRLQLISGDPPDAQIATEICLPQEFANGP